MSEHTQGRLRAVRDDLMLEVGRFRMARGVTACGSSKGMIDDREISYANARRLAAAWNACEGMSTDDIEELAACQQGVMKLAIYADDMREKLAKANARIAKLENLVAERDAMLGQRPCQNNRCNEINAARALLREVLEAVDSRAKEYSDRGLEVAEVPEIARVRNYLDACDTLEGNKPVDKTGCRKCGDILPAGHYCKAPACPLNPSMKVKS